MRHCPALLWFNDINNQVKTYHPLQLFGVFLGDGLKELKSLKILHLGSNKLTSLEAHELKTCSNITFLDLSNNNLSTLQVSIPPFTGKISESVVIFVIRRDKSCISCSWKYMMYLVLILSIYLLLWYIVIMTSLLIRKWTTHWNFHALNFHRSSW